MINFSSDKLSLMTYHVSHIPKVIFETSTENFNTELSTRNFSVIISETGKYFLRSAERREFFNAPHFTKKTKIFRGEMTETGKERVDKNQEILFEFGKSFGFDRRLFFAAIQVDSVYCNALFHAGIITRAESERIRNGLQTLVKRAEFNRNFFDEAALTDVHEFVETRLVQLIGDAGEKLSVGRSKIDRSQTAFRLWLRVEIEDLSQILRNLQTVLLASGEKNKQAILPVRLKNDWQIVLWAHWCLAYFERFGRDRERLDETWRRVNILPLGAANLTGASIEIDREEIAAELNFEGVTANSLDATFDADYAVEFLAACSTITAHLSNLADDLSAYNSAELNFVEIAGANSENAFDSPKISDALEIVRARLNLIFGNQFALLSIVKNATRDAENNLREIQKIVFETLDVLKSCLQTTLIILEKTHLNEAAIEKAAQNYSGQNELFDYLIFRGVTLRTARNVAAKIKSHADAQGKKTNQLSLKEMRQFSETINEDVFTALSLEQILAGKNQIGGTAPDRVSEALEAARDSLRREEN